MHHKISISLISKNSNNLKQENLKTKVTSKEDKRENNPQQSQLSESSKPKTSKIEIKAREEVGEMLDVVQDRHPTPTNKQNLNESDSL